MVDITLHVQDWHPGGFGHLVYVLVAHHPITVTDGDAIKIATIDLANFLGCVAVGDLGGGTFNECTMTAQLSHASFK